MTQQLSAEQTKIVDRLFIDLLSITTSAELPRMAVVALLTKIIVMLSLDQVDREQFMDRMAYVYDFESFLKPDQLEIH